MSQIFSFQNNPHVRLAVLIDADNSQSDMMTPIMNAVRNYGDPIIRRAYGDWAMLPLKWKEELSRHAIQPIQQFAYKTGKNTTDIALIIDAMDILHAGQVDGFCIVSSDSDYLRLAIRLREAGSLVIGVGSILAMPVFIQACHQYIPVEFFKKRPEIIKAVTALNSTPAPVDFVPPPPVPAKPVLEKPDIVQVYLNVFKHMNGQLQAGGWVTNSIFSQEFKKRYPRIDLKAHQVSQVIDVFRKYTAFFETSGDYVRIKPEPGSAEVEIKAPVRTPKAPSPKPDSEKTVPASTFSLFRRNSTEDEQPVTPPAEGVSQPATPASEAPPRPSGRFSSPFHRAGEDGAEAPPNRFGGNRPGFPSRSSQDNDKPTETGNPFMRPGGNRPAFGRPSPFSPRPPRVDDFTLAVEAVLKEKAEARVVEPPVVEAAPSVLPEVAPVEVPVTSSALEIPVQVVDALAAVENNPPKPRRGRQPKTEGALETPTPKKRGRKAAEPVAEVASEKLKRGRKKAEAATVTSLAEMPAESVKPKRGRKPKAT